MYRFLKRLTDILFSLLAILVCSPLFVLISFLMKLEALFWKDARGPLLRSEERISEGKPFPLYKFRFIKQSILDEEKVIRRRDRQKTLEKDEYCTRTGRILKKWYADELPQLFNILRGDMSWVGPRPFPVDDYQDDLRLGRTRKKVVPAGLTGLTQIHKGKAESKTDVEYDNDYIRMVETYSPLRMWLKDFQIMILTIKTICEGKGL